MKNISVSIIKGLHKQAFCDKITFVSKRRHVGMADEADYKRSVVGNYVWVQVPLPALSQALSDQGFFYAIRNHFAMFLLRKKRVPEDGDFDQVECERSEL